MFCVWVQPTWWVRGCTPARSWIGQSWSYWLGYFAFDKFVLTPQRDATQRQQQRAELEVARQAGRTEALVESYSGNSIAVLPFADMSPEGDQAYFSDGISEELLNVLAGPFLGL
jgi:hypothetical protein